MSLVDAGIGLAETEARIATAKAELEKNGTALIAARGRVVRLREASAQQSELSDQVRELSKLFDSATVKEQEGWNKESAKLKKVGTALSAINPDPIALPAAPAEQEVAENADLFTKTKAIVDDLKAKVTKAEEDIRTAVAAAKTDLGLVFTDWNTRRAAFDAKLDAELKKVDPESSLTALRTHLDTLQTKVATASAAKDELTDEAMPRTQVA